MIWNHSRSILVYLANPIMRDYAAIIVTGSWLTFAPIMIVRLPGLFGRTARRSYRSILGILITAVAFALVWPRTWLATPHSALAPAFGAALGVVSAVFGNWAFLVLGRQWSIQARLRADHRLVTTGPYRLVRHPVYTAFFGLLVATGLVFGSTPGLLLAIPVYAAGTALRIRAEDTLLRERFGLAFDEYTRRTPAVIPRLWR